MNHPRSAFGGAPSFLSPSRGPRRRTGGAGSAARLGGGGAVLAVVLLFSGCAATQVRSLATAGAPAYELQGRSLFALERQAQALCPSGHVVVRRWEKLQRPDADGAFESWWAPAAWLDPPQAQMTVQCKA